MPDSCAGTGKLEMALAQELLPKHDELGLGY